MAEKKAKMKKSIVVKDIKKRDIRSEIYESGNMARELEDN